MISQEKMIEMIKENAIPGSTQFIIDNALRVYIFYTNTDILYIGMDFQNIFFNYTADRSNTNDENHKILYNAIKNTLIKRG